MYVYTCVCYICHSCLEIYHVYNSLKHAILQHQISHFLKHACMHNTFTPQIARSAKFPVISLFSVAVFCCKICAYYHHACITANGLCFRHYFECYLQVPDENYSISKQPAQSYSSQLWYYCSTNGNRNFNILSDTPVAMCLV